MANENSNSSCFMTKKRCAILASGRGSNARNILEQAARAQFPNLDICLVISDKRDAPVLEMARTFDIMTMHVPYSSRKEQKLITALMEQNIEWIFLAGFMRILGPDLLTRFYDESMQVTRIINIHPSLLPDFPGLEAYERAFTSNASPVGVTVHFVDSGVDTGPIIAQREFPRLVTDNLDDFKDRGLKTEHGLYIDVLKKLNDGTLTPSRDVRGK